MQNSHSRKLTALLFVAAMLIGPTPVQGEADGAKIYKANCTLCHSENGSGNSPSGKALKAKDLRSEEVQKESDATLSETIAKGKGKMPAFGARIKADDLEAVVAHLRTLAAKK